MKEFKTATEFAHFLRTGKELPSMDECMKELGDKLPLLIELDALRARLERLERAAGEYLTALDTYQSKPGDRAGQSPSRLQAETSRALNALRAALAEGQGKEGG